MYDAEAGHYNEAGANPRVSRLGISESTDAR
jgi:hypothetical protein